jgi:hypothetical protein
MSAMLAGAVPGVNFGDAVPGVNFADPLGSADPLNTGLLGPADVPAMPPDRDPSSANGSDPMI